MVTTYRSWKQRLFGLMKVVLYTIEAKLRDAKSVQREKSTLKGYKIFVNLEARPAIVSQEGSFGRDECQKRAMETAVKLQTRLLVYLRYVVMSLISHSKYAPRTLCIPRQATSRTPFI